MIWPLLNFKTGRPFVITMNCQDSPHCVMAVVHLFSLQHGLHCAKGAVAKKGHNDLRDSDARRADVAWDKVVVEPLLVPENDKKLRPLIHADWMARGVRGSNLVVFLHNHIIYADTPSYVKANLSWNAIATCAASAKKAKYCPAAEELQGSFISLVCSMDGVSIVNMQCIRNSWHVASPLSGKSHIQSLHLGFVFRRSWQSLDPLTLGCVAFTTEFGALVCRMERLSELASRCNPQTQHTFISFYLVVYIICLPAGLYTLLLTCINKIVYSLP